MSYLLLILLGGPVAITVPLLVARHLVEKHAVQYAATVAEQHQAAEHQAAVDRLIAAAHTDRKAITR
jgi:hypothetical protein